MSKQNKTINKQILKELLNRETFTYEKGADFGDGKMSTPNQISTNKTSDELAQMVVQPPSNKFPMDGIGRGFIGEAKGITEAIFAKVDDDPDFVDENKAELKKVKQALNKIDFSKVDEATKEKLINKIRNNG